MKILFRAVCIFLLLYLSFNVVEVAALQTGVGRWIRITLIPDYVTGEIRFDAQIDLGDPSSSLDLGSWPLIIEHQWPVEHSSIWNITGTIRDGKVIVTDAPGGKSYSLSFGPIHLQPNDRLSLILPFVNLDYNEIEPPVDPPDAADAFSRQRTNLFTYTGGDSGRDICILKIPFRPLVMKVDLTLVPLVGEALAGKESGLRFSGRVQFENIRDFKLFSLYSQTPREDLRNGDYRVGHLLYNLDYPSYFGPDVLNSIYAVKPTKIVLRSDLSFYQYDEAKEIGQVQATFSGRVFSVIRSAELFPSELRGSDFPDRNYSFSSGHHFADLQGYRLQLGKILLAPGDVLILTLPNAQVQPSSLQPTPSAFENSGDLKITYAGPASFELSLVYFPQTNLYASQFPSLLRPGLSALEDQMEEGSLLAGSGVTWLVLVLGPLLYLLSLFIPNLKWLSIPGWLLITASFYYGVRGSFGLLGVAMLFYAAPSAIPGSTSNNRPETLPRLIKALVGLALIVVAVYLDLLGFARFQGLAGPELSPLTPLVLMLLSIALFLLLYGRSVKLNLFTRSDLPVLILFLVVLSLYDAFDKSVLSLLILFAVGVYIIHRAIQSGAGKAPPPESRWGNNLRRRWKLAFGNRLTLLAILILMVFAILHDLSSIYANEMQVSMSPVFAPLVIPLLVIVSVCLTFSSIALLFVLVYPFIPLKTGYLKAAAFSLVLFLIFLFGIGTDNRLIASLPNILVGRVIYYLSVPMLIGVTLDIREFLRNENKLLSAQGAEKKKIDIRTAISMYFKNLQGMLSTAVGVVSLVAPTLYAFLSSQPVITTYFGLLEKLAVLAV